MDQDLLIIIGGAAFATALLIAGFMWEVRRSRRPLKARPPAAPRSADAPRWAIKRGLVYGERAVGLSAAAETVAQITASIPNRHRIATSRL